MLEEDIDRTVDEYWGEIYVRENSEEGRKKHRKHLIEKYDKKIMTKYIAFDKEMKGAETPEFIEFVYKTGLYEDALPETTIMYRENLKMLIKYGSKKNEFSLLDLGSGADKTTTGLALFLDNISHICAVEQSKHGIIRMNEHINNLDSEDIMKVKNKIITFDLDYTSKEFIDEFSGKRFDNILMSFQPYDYIDLTRFLRAYRSAAIISKDFELIISIYHNHSKNHTDQTNSEMIMSPIRDSPTRL